MNNHGMDVAIIEAKSGVENGDGGPFGAVVIHNGIIVGKGHNEVVLHNDPTAHAEILAIRRACEALNSHQLEDCDIYTSCEPCPMCLGAIYWCRPRKVYYAASREDAERAGFDDDHIYRQLALPHQDRVISFEQTGHEKVKKIFSAWSRNNLNNLY